MARPKAETPPDTTEQADDSAAKDGERVDVGQADLDQGEDAFEGEINTSLDEVLDLLAQEVERLQVALEYYRLSEHPDKQQLIRWHVQQIDARQDRLEDIKAMILSRGEDSVH